MLVVPAGTALADGPVVDPGGGGGIGTTIDLPGSPGGPGPVEGGPPGGGGGGGGGSDVKCSYLHFPQFDDAGPPPTEVYRYTCDDGSEGYVTVGAGQAPAGGVSVTPEQLAQRIYKELQLPKPAVQLNPPADEPGRFQIVNFPIWWWVNNFAPLEQRTELGAVWAEVTATPVYSVFDGGQGDSAQCNGAGTVWHRGLPGDYAPACKYVYKRAANSVTATISLAWKVTWVGSGGSGGDFPLMQTTTGVPLTVYERQAVNVPYGS